MRFRQGLTVAVVTLVLGAVPTASAASAFADAPVGQSKPKKLKVTSRSFANNEAIPVSFTCEGIQASPALKYTKIPKSSKDLALIVTDPDAPGGTFVHWVAWRLPKSGLPEREQNEPAEFIQGSNETGAQSYLGPCPPPGPAHRYVFTVYSVSKAIELAPGATADELRASIQGSVVAQGKITGKYQRG